MERQSRSPDSSNFIHETFPHNPTIFTREKNTHGKAMKKFEELIFKLAEAHPNTPLTPASKSLVRDRLNQLLSQYKTPDHPPYSAMIERALRELNQKGGSSEKSISQFLEKEYKDLPWGHLMLLKHHLGKLCESGDIVLTHGKKYMFGGADPSRNRKPRKRKVRRDWERDRNKRRNSKRSQQKGEEVTKKHRESDVQEKDEDEQMEKDGAKWSKQAADDNASELPMTPERPPGFESVIVKSSELLSLPSKLDNLDSPGVPSENHLLKQSKYQPTIIVTQVEEMTSGKTSSYEPERQQEILSGQKAFGGKETLISQALILSESRQREISEGTDAREMLSKISRRSSSRIRNKSKRVNEKEKPGSRSSEGPVDVDVLVTEDSSKSNREKRQLKRWNSRSPVAKSSTESSPSLALSSNLETGPDCQNVRNSTRITKHNRQQPRNQERHVLKEEDVHRGIKRYGRRAKDKFQQPKINSKQPI